MSNFARQMRHQPPPLKDVRLKKAQEVLTEGQKAHAQKVAELAEAVSKPLLGYCSNLECPYRERVLRARQKDLAKKQRQRAK